MLNKVYVMFGSIQYLFANARVFKERLRELEKESKLSAV
jgi:hypothetical protein